MTSQKDGAPPEIVIVRRKSGNEEDGHHGGVWKIAYADFMTAMMAFFLVMWLINASNTETKASVASYFNPIKLTDSQTFRKGLRDPDAKPEASPAMKGERGSAGDGSKGAARRDADGRPESAPSPGQGDPATEQEQALPAGDPALPGTAAFRDPFNLSQGAALLSEKVAASPPSIAETVFDVAEAAPHASPTKESRQPHVEGDRPDPVSGLRRAAENLRQQAVRETERLALTGGPGVDVMIEGDAIVLSLTDTTSFGMFAVGSADPSPELVALLQAMAPIISGNGERLIVRGHTDARPWRTATGNNNWRLSMARAETAYALLIGSGIDDARFERIEAHAERRPKLTDEPEAAANRRIEILLRAPQ